MSRGRLEAFSDGVIAIAITLLVLDLRVPLRSELGDESLAHALRHEWPSFAAFAVSFAVIGIMWVNHHALLGQIATIDRKLVLANLFLLGVIATIPFSTALFAEYVRDPGTDGHVAAAIYSSTMFLSAVGFTMLASRIYTGRALLRFSAGLVVYAASIVVALISAPAALILHGAIAVYYAFDQLTSVEPAT
jgi:uncharacterized membrane protein